MGVGGLGDGDGWKGIEDGFGRRVDTHVRRER